MNKVSVRHTSFSPIRGVGGRALAVGVSVRALVAALNDSSFRVISVDAFGDQDTRENVEQTIILPQWGTTMSELSLQTELDSGSLTRSDDSQAKPLCPVFGAGGTENWPELISYLTGHPKLRSLAPSQDQLKLLRSARLWAQAAQQSGIGFPQSIDHLGPFGQGANNTLASRWLLKKLNSGGGSGVSVCELASVCSISPNEYVQQEICGPVMGVNFCVAWNRTLETAKSDLTPNLTWMGVVQSWSGEQWPGPTEFAYRGSWGPVAISEPLRARLEYLALLIAKETGITGWLQMDCIESSDGQWWLLEVNPRWTAGMEVLLRSGVTNPAAHHAAAWGYPSLEPQLQVRQPNTLIGKAIVYAPSELLLDNNRVDLLHSLPRERFADIPSNQMKGRWLDAGSPVLTVLASCAPHVPQSEAQQILLEQLRLSAQQVRDILNG